MGEPKDYRLWIRDIDLFSFHVMVKETDLYIRATSNLRSKAMKSVAKWRSSLESYIERHPEFMTALEPLDATSDAPQIVKEMIDVSKSVGIGPMSAVAGAIAERVGRDLLPFSSEVIVENGGDIFLRSYKLRRVGIFAGESPFTGKLAIEIGPEEEGLGICTSSGTVGHSLSYGKADAVVVISPSTSLADATATAVGNMVRTSDDIPMAIDFAEGITSVIGGLVIKEDKLGAWGEVKLCPTW
ncbi:MAG: UPF0280 family protein [Chloroflexota bacterium]|nr:UPF0280 family protein [Chloroflexota bacterium]